MGRRVERVPRNTKEDFPEASLRSRSELSVKFNVGKISAFSERPRERCLRKAQSRRDGMVSFSPQTFLVFFSPKSDLSCPTQPSMIQKVFMGQFSSKTRRENKVKSAMEGCGGKVATLESRRRALLPRPPFNTHLPLPFQPCLSKSQSLRLVSSRTASR